jgi:hypothetical protein
VDHQPPPPVQNAAENPPYPAQWNGKTNGLACISFLMSLVGCGLLFAIVFGIIGLRQATRNGDKKGRRYAIAGLSISGIWLIVLAVAIGVSIAQGPDRDETGVVRGDRPIAFADVRTGDCIENLFSQTGEFVDVVPCTEPHDTEVVARPVLPAGDWPGDAPIMKAARTSCDELFVAYTGRTLPDPSYISIPAPPDALGWPGDRSAICLAFRDDATTGSVRR